MASIDDHKATSFRVGAYEISPSLNQIALDEESCSLEPKVMDVLCVLAENPEEVISRSELIERVWGVEFGGDESLSRAVSQLRKAFKTGDDNAEYIETIPKRGYRLVQPVAQANGGAEPQVPSQTIAQPNGSHVASAPASYSVAMLPLQSSSGEDERFAADDIGRDLVSTMSRTPHLKVAAYDPGLGSRNVDADFRRTAEDLSVSYIVTGSLVRHGDKIALRVSLIDGMENRHLMSWKFLEEAAQFDEKVDDLVLDLSTSIVSEIQIAEAAMAHLRPDPASDGFAVILSTEMQRIYYSEKRANEISEHLTELVAREPDNAIARAALASHIASSVVSHRSSDPMLRMEQARSHLAVALKLAPNDADVIASAGVTFGMLNERPLAIRYLQRALEMNPNDPNTLAVLGLQIGMMGEGDRGLELIRTAERRAPHHPRRCLWIYYRAVCQVTQNNLVDAGESFLETAELNPNWHMPYFAAANCLAVQGRDDEARDVLEFGMTLKPDFDIEKYFEVLQHWKGLHKSEESRKIAFQSMRRIWPQITDRRISAQPSIYDQNSRSKSGNH